MTLSTAISTQLSVLFCIALLLVLPTLSYCQSNATTSSNNDCPRNCTGLDQQPLCASNGKTYNNRCEMKKDACLNPYIIEIVKEADGPCIVPTTEEPVKRGETCAQHQERITDLMDDDDRWSTQCNNTRFKEKGRAGELTLNDVIDCYKPECSSLGNYLRTQCYSVGSRYPRWCWCSGPEGLGINGTFTSNMNSTYCSTRDSCQYNGDRYEDGAVFRPSHGCGICQCLDGNVTCFDDFVPDTQGRLNVSQLNQLSDLLKQFFFFENKRKSSIVYDIMDILLKIQEIPGDVWQSIINSWFDHYDSDGNGFLELNHQEETAFHNHLSDLTHCKHFLDHVSDGIDVDNSTSITRTEWNDFFRNHTVTTVETDDSIPDISRRSVSDIVLPRPQRKTLERRKKFLYVLNL